MSIKITLGRLLGAVDSKAIANVSALVPPGSYHFRIAKLFDAIDREVTDFRKQNNALIKKFGVAEMRTEGNVSKLTGNISMVGATPENITAFNDAMAELLAMETSIPYEPVIWSKLGEEAQKKLTINDVRALGPLLVEDDAALAAANAAAPLAAIPLSSANKP